MDKIEVVKMYKYNGEYYVSPTDIVRSEFISFLLPLISSHFPGVSADVNLRIRTFIAENITDLHIDFDGIREDIRKIVEE